MNIEILHTSEQLEAILPLVNGYRTFYGLEPDPEAARAYLPRFLAPSKDGVLLAAFDGQEPLGYACVHWRRSTYHLRDDAYLSDLFVAEQGRGRGTGHALLSAARDAADERSLKSLAWLTAVDNRTAQRLYERFDTERAALFEYELPVDNSRR